MKVVIAYEDSMLNFGAIQLRAFQVADSLRRFMEVDVLPISECSHFKNTLFILVKIRTYNLFRRLLGRGNFLILDVLDTIDLLEKPTQRIKQFFGITGKEILKEVDAGIFCSDKSKNKYKSLFKTPDLCATIYHHWDSRLSQAPSRYLAQVRFAYIGLRRKAFLESALSDINFHRPRSHLELSPEFLGQYNAHYVVKPEEHFYQFEPLTKLSIAAVARSPVIASKGHEQELLTADYPYYISSLTEHSVLSQMELMQQTYRGSDWLQAIEIMEAVYDRTSLEQTSNEYIKLIRRIISKDCR